MSLTARGEAYCTGRLKRAFDMMAASIALLVLAPLIGFIAILIRVTSGSPILFRQERLGIGGRPFQIMKFRTMLTEATGLPITGRGDNRITSIGRVLRKSKIDEIPQLFNVVRGDMSMVGPRPELPRYVAMYTAAQRRVLDVRPGLTDDATILFRDEEQLLGQVAQESREKYYVERIMPRKLALNLGYIEQAGFLRDLSIIVKTIGAIVTRHRR